MFINLFDVEFYLCSATNVHLAFEFLLSAPYSWRKKLMTLKKLRYIQEIVALFPQNAYYRIY